MQTMPSNRTPPHSLEAERCVIGTILMFNRALDEISLTRDDFYRDSHKEIFGAIVELQSSGTPADLVTICEVLKNKGKLEFVGGPSYLAETTDVVPAVSAIGNYAKIVSDHRKRRDAILAASEVIGMAYEGADVETITEAAQGAFFGIETGTGGAVELAALVNDSIKSIERRQKCGGVTGITTGFLDLDKSTAGLQPSDLIIVAGRPSMGKTALAMNMVESAASTGVPVAVFSLEMSGGQLSDRMLSGASGVSSGRIRTGQISEGNWSSIVKAAGKLAMSPIFIDDSPALPIAELRRRARRLKMKHNIGLVVVDYMQLATSAKAKSREQEISDISRQLKAMAKELKISVVGIAQLNRDLEKRPDKRPMCSDLRDSGQIEQDADLILFVYRDEIYNKQSTDKGIAEVIIGKQRNGPLGVVKLQFRGETMTFRDLA